MLARSLLIKLILALTILTAPAWARVPEAQFDLAVPCAVVEEFDGGGDILAPGREFLSPIQKGVGVPCQGWMAVKTGHVILKHREGQKIHLGESAFIQIQLGNPDGKNQTEQLVLLRGEAFIQAVDGSVPFRVLTTHSRAKVENGSMIVVYNQEQEESQVFALGGKVSFENRFVAVHQTELRPGEVSSLNLEAGRVVPSHPQAVALATLKPKFTALEIDTRDRDRAVKSAKTRNQKIFSTNLLNPVSTNAPSKMADLEAEKVRASLAVQAEEQKRASYRRHETRKEAAKMTHQVLQRSVAGLRGTASLLNPTHTKKTQVVQVIDSDPRAKIGSSDPEKKKLIEELSRIKEE